MIRRILSAICATTLALVATPTGAGAATNVLAVGWWTSNPVADAPAGGVQVAAGPHGEVSRAAVRLDLGRGVTSAVLSLAEAGGAGQALAAIDVCRGDESWTPASPGALDAAPDAACGTAPVAAVRQNGTWTANITELVDGVTGSVTVVLVAASGAAPVSAWEVRLAPPALAAGEVAAAPPTSPAPPATPAPSSSTTPPQSASAPPPAASAPVSPRSPSVLPASDRTPATGPAAADVVPVDAVPGSDVDQALEFAEGFVAPRAGDGDDGRPWGKAFAYVVLSALVGAAAAVTRRRLIDR